MPKTAPRAKGWWGSGKAPHLRYPGVTIAIPSVWSKKRERWESPDGRYFYDQAEADRYTEFFPGCLRLHIGEFAGQPFHLLDYAEWLIVRPLFGWKHADSGLRRFRKVFLAIPKGNAKSPLAAGLGLALLTIDDEPGAEVYAFAADKQQAGIVFGDSKIMVENSPDLLEELVVYKDAIVNRSTRSKYQVRSKTVATSHGPRPHALLGDEFHAQQNRDLFESMHRGTYKRRQPVTFLCTTAGDDDESICAEEWEYAQKVISGTVEDETLLPVIFEARADEDWQDERVWARVNPGLGVTVKLEGIRQAAKEAAAEPRKRNDFLRYHLNKWVNQAVAWLPIEWWDACRDPLPDDAVLAGLACASGLDLSQKTDLTAFVSVFREYLPEGEVVVIQVAQEETEEGEAPAPVALSLNFRIHLVPHFWLPRDTLAERVKQDRVQYDVWADQKILTVTDGGMIDYSKILKDITRTIGPRYNLVRGQVGYDPAFASDLAPKLVDAGYQMVEILQGYKYLSEPAQVFEALLKNRRVTHGGRHKLMRWCVENVAIKTDDSGRIRPVKPKRAAKRIDGVVAALMALNRLLADHQQRSLYEERELRFL